MLLRQPVGRLGQGGGIGKIAREGIGNVLRMLLRRAQSAEQFVARVR